MTRCTHIICDLFVASFLALAVFAQAAWAGDSLDGLTPLSPASLGNVTFKNNLFTIQDLKNDSTVTGNSVQAINGGRVTNGAITNNIVSNNHGITTVLQNTGNNVSFNNAMILNLILNH